MDYLEIHLCPDCLRFLPIAEFRRRSRHGSARMAKCRECHNQAERARRATRRSCDQHRRLGKALTRLGNQQDAKPAALLVGIMVDQFGGLENLALLWREHYDRARPRSYGRFRTLQALLSLTSSTCAPVADNYDPMDPTRMSDNELGDALEWQIRRIVADHPEIAISAAADLGWQVIPPRDHGDVRDPADEL